MKRPGRPYLILAFDPNATRTGYALFEIPGPASAISMSHFTSEVKDRDDRMALISQELKTIIAADPKPDIIIFEAALPYVIQFAKGGGSSTQLMLAEIHGKIEQAATDYSIPYEHVQPQSWRAALYGKGGGKMSTKAAKKMAVDYCRFRNLPAPANHDEAEAACIAMWAADCSVTLKQLMYGSRAA